MKDVAGYESPLQCVVQAAEKSGIAGGDCKILNSVASVVIFNVRDCRLL